MKRSVALLIAITLVFCLFSCKSSSEDSSILLPTVGKIEESVPENGEKLFFDENGNLEKIIKYVGGTIFSIREYSSSGEFVRYTEYTDYGHFTEDKLPNNVNAKISYFDKNSSLIESIAYTYHESGVIASETAYASGGEVKGVWHFDDSGVSTETEFYSLDGGRYTFLERAKYFYYPDGSPEKTLFFKGRETPSSEIRYLASGDIDSVIYYGSDGEISSYTVFEYSENGRSVSESTFGADGNIISLILYGEDQNKISFTSYSENGLPALVYKYRAGGILSEIERYGDNGGISSTEFFDESGARTGATFYNSDGSFLICDADFDPIEGVQYTHDSYGGYVRHTYENSAIIEEIVSRDGINTDSIRAFDENGFVSEETLYQNGKLVLRREFQRDADGNTVTYTDHETNGTTLTYSSEGLIISGVKYYYSKGTISKKVEYENGYMTKETMYSSGSIVLISLFDENGALEKESFYSNGKLSRVREYDGNGVLRKDTVYNERGKVSSVTKYDEKGNKI